MKATRLSVAQVTEACLGGFGARKATVFLSRDLVVKASRKHKPHRERQATLVLTVGKPNYDERQFIKACDKAGEPFPVRKVQLKWWPAKKR